jgi:ABC-type dipeptide/oligopeptide/nickel transport system ATPase component
MSGSPTRPVLSVNGLAVELRDGKRWLRVVDDVTFSLDRGEVLALVGESGSGKSKTAEAILGLLPAGNSRTRGQIRLGDADLTGMPEAGLCKTRGSRISMVFQEPLTALDPVFSCGSQLAAIYRRHRGLNRTQARQAAAGMLPRVGFADAGRIMDSYPHQLSGGMRQRVLIAMAMACNPEVLIADEPTTALDVTTQALVLERLTALCKDAGTALLLITHDLGIVAQYADRALVMKSGRLVEGAPVADLFRSPAQAYTQELIRVTRDLQS